MYSYHLGKQLIATKPIHTLQQIHINVQFQSNAHQRIIILFRDVLLGFLLLLLLLEDFVVERVVGGELVLVLLDGFGLLADFGDVLVYVYVEGYPVVFV